ncbi:ATP-binding protein [Hoeflea sp.]|uniref:hybrid sensor histidine kinase/response regulator n=1 Tax=Hoeflea sp. TaxID=1940281 RepID=UPI0019C710AC|nr:ATP-binding protein [Hoeflea sp.]MBC7282968.1 response regulator [Hoeflea sp.]
MENIELLQQFDWSRTSLGPLTSWPDDRRAIAETVLRSTFPVCLALGNDLVQIYNVGYNRILGEKHPDAFGEKASKTWPEIWSFLEPTLKNVQIKRQPQEFLNFLLPLNKSGILEECYFTFCYSPIFSADGTVVGVMSIAMETTQESIEERRRPLTGFSIEPPVGHPHPISDKLREVLAHNELDAMAALVSSGVEPKASTEWALRCNDETVEKLLAVVRENKMGQRCGIVPMAPPLGNPAHANFLGYITFTAADGRTEKTLVLWPSALVTERSFLDLVNTLQKRIQAASHQIVSIKNIRDELLQSDLLYRFLFENTLDGVIYSSTNCDGTGPETIIAVNRAACEMVGYEEVEMLGMRREEFFFADDGHLASAVAERAKQNIFSGELTFRHKDGSPVSLDIVSVLAQLESGERRTISILRDFSERLSAERSRAERVRLETVAQMTGGISHDFNNLLTIILSAAEYLETSIADRDHIDVVRDILIATTRAANLTSQLLTYSRKQNLRPAFTDVNSAIKEIERLVQGAAGKDVDVRYDYSRKKLFAALDVTHLTSALVNLVKNASDAISARGTIRVSTRTARISVGMEGTPIQPGNYVAISIKDRGTGIPAELMKRVFDPFFTLKANMGGSGLGLSMVQGFARQSGGDILIRSSPEKGTVATLYFPLMKTSRPKRNALEFSSRNFFGDALIVDDDPIIRRQVARAIRAIGMNSKEASSGAEAIDLLKTGPALVITDLAMPGERTGGDVVEACRRARPAIPVILMTGFAADRQWLSLNSEETEILTKPFARRELLAAIDRVKTWGTPK